MRQVLSWRFVAAVAAVAALALVTWAVQARSGSALPGVVSQRSDEQARRMDFISLVAQTETNDFAMTPNGTASGELTLVMPDGQRVPVFPGTPGVVECDDLDGQYECAVLGQSLGDTVVWFALLPMRAEFRFVLPAIVDLEGGFAHLENGWEVPFARVIDRGCDPDVASFSEFLEKHGQDFRSIYDLSVDAIVAVEC